MGPKAGCKMEQVFLYRISLTILLGLCIIDAEKCWGFAEPSLRSFFRNIKRRRKTPFEERKFAMIYSAEVQNMCSVAKGAYHGPAPIPEEGKWVQAKEIKDISGFTHGIGWGRPPSENADWLRP